MCSPKKDFYLSTNVNNCNHNTKFVNELYKGFNIHVIEAKRMINSKAKGRGTVEYEINYGKEIITKPLYLIEYKLEEPTPLTQTTINYNDYSRNTNTHIKAVM